MLVCLSSSFGEKGHYHFKVGYTAIGLKLGIWARSRYNICKFWEYTTKVVNVHQGCSFFGLKERC
jgi:hypothetical protein